MDVLFKLQHPLSLDQYGGDSGLSLQGRDVVVLAKNFRLSRPQRELLKKGLFFVPALYIGKNEKLKFEFDMQAYHRKVKLATYFRNSKRRDKMPFTGPSDWSPPVQELPPEVGTLIHRDLEKFKRCYKPIRERQNISLAEIRALRELKNAKHIVIKPADKGSAVVILSREQYTFEVQRQLQDTTYYRKLDKPLYLDTIPIVKNILKSLKDKKFINSKQYKYLLGSSQPRERRFYILPKIHKAPDKWTIPYEIPPGRPIVSDCESETYRTAEFLDFYLNPLSVKHPAYVKDTYHFIDIVKNLKIAEDFYFFSMDVDNLYTNIPIEAGIATVRNIFQKFPDPKRPDQELLQLLEINLTKNDFMFDEQFYLQVKGTAMGKKFAPAYANIFMANWEAEVLPRCKKKPAHYLRYLDDIWGIWTGSELEFTEFVQTLNSHDPSIQLKFEINREAIDFLDTTVFKGPTFNITRKLDIKVFFKSTDTHALLHKFSFHPKHTFRGIVKSQLLRFQRICTQPTDFRKAVITLFKALRERGYSRPFLKKCLKTFQEDSEKVKGDLLPLISTFSSNSRYFNRHMKNHFDEVIGQAALIPNSRVISAFRRNKNLADLLVRARLPRLNSSKPRYLEALFTKLEFVRNVKDRTIISVMQSFSPQTKNCVYVIFCSKCGKKYVGETGNDLYSRLYQHVYNIRKKKEPDAPLVAHFLKHGWDSLRMAGLQQGMDWTDWERKKRERYWIYTLGTKEPLGLNVKWN